MYKRLIPLATLCGFLIAGQSEAAPVVWNFAISDQGFATSRNKGTGASADANFFTHTGSQWQVDGARADPAGTGGNIETWVMSILTAPDVLADGTEFLIALDHTFDFETDWDGARMYVSLDGGLPQAVGIDIGNFSVGGYTGVLTEGGLDAPPDFTPWKGEAAWTGIRTGSSVASLGTLAAGTQVSISLRALWDAESFNTNPNWQVTQIQISGVPLPGTLALITLGGLGLGLHRRRRKGGHGVGCCLLPEE